MDVAPPQRTPYDRTAEGNRRQQTRLSRFVFTLNHWTQEEYDAIKSNHFQWMVVAKETGDNGTPHLQGAVVIGKQTAFSTIKMWPGFRRAHLEPMYGTPKDSLVYCSKQDSNPFVIGTLPTPGKSEMQLKHDEWLTNIMTKYPTFYKKLDFY